MTSKERILSDLAGGDWYCGSAWYANWLPTFSQRVSEMNAEHPGLIESRVCRNPEHQHKSSIHEYRLADRQLRLAV